MNLSPEMIIMLISAILFASTIISKVCYKIGVPTLIMFLTMGMIIGSDGIGGLALDSPDIAMLVGTFALNFIIFNGGLSTTWKEVKPVVIKSAWLATLGVFLTAVITGVFASIVLDLTLMEGLLLGSIVASTDAAATFSILRSNGIVLKRNIGELLEMESGSNDPMAYMLTITVMSVCYSTSSFWSTSGTFLLTLLKQLAIGAVLGLILGYIFPIIINKIKLHTESIYTILIIGMALLIFSAASLLGGNGFLAVYIAGVLIGNKNFLHKAPLIKFFDGQSWLMQILLFVTLGLMVYPRQLPAVMFDGLIISLFIIFIARPLVIFGILSFFKTPFKDMVLIAWSGLRGAASMVFALYPLIAGFEIGPYIFNIVFFVAVSSMIIQGTLLPKVAKWLDLVDPINDNVRLENFGRYIDEMSDSLMDVKVIKNSPAVDKKLFDLDLPKEVRIIRIRRGRKYIVPVGDTKIKAFDDILLIAQDHQNVDAVRAMFEEHKEKEHVIIA